MFGNHCHCAKSNLHPKHPEVGPATPLVVPSYPCMQGWGPWNGVSVQSLTCDSCKESAISYIFTRVIAACTGRGWRFDKHVVATGNV